MTNLPALTPTDDEETISITTEGPNEFTVRIGDRYHPRMTWEEMLGQIAELTHPRIDKARFMMSTAEEWAAKEARFVQAVTDAEDERKSDG